MVIMELTYRDSPIGADIKSLVSKKNKPYLPIYILYALTVLKFENKIIPKTRPYKRGMQDIEKAGRRHYHRSLRAIS